jgi:hypothetical protein
MSWSLSEDRAASVDEGHQRIERPTAQLDRSAIGQQLATMADDLEPAKFNGTESSGCPATVSDCSATLQTLQKECGCDKTRAVSLLRASPRTRCRSEVCEVRSELVNEER